MPMISLDQIIDGPNVRTIAAGADADDGLRRSIAASGILQPVLLRLQRLPGDDAPIPVNGRGNKLEVILGARRIAAARALGLTEVPAEVRELTDQDAAAAQLAENVQRQEMHPVDQWRGVRALVDGGMTVAQACGALGLDHRVTRRMELMGRLDPGLLALCEIQMPAAHQMAVIAAATPKAQAAAAKARDLVIEHENGARTVVWQTVKSRLTVDRISRARAIFDLDDPGLVWDEDLFAEPGSDEQWTTADIELFMRRQTAALEAQVRAAGGEKKRRAVAAMRDAVEVRLPPGFRPVHDGNPDKPRRDEWVFHAIRPDGSVRVQMAFNTKSASAETHGKAGAPDPEPEDDGETDAGSRFDDEDNEPPPAPVTNAPYTAAGLAMIAAAKTGALRRKLTEPMDCGTVLALLLLALSGDNVRIYGSAAPDRLKRMRGRLIQPGGQLESLDDGAVAGLGRAVLSDLLRCGGPDMPGSEVSGAPAEWIGAAIGAADCLPRFDTMDFLAAARTVELKRIAAAVDLPVSGSATALRARLAGHAPDWRPDLAVFGAPMPTENPDV